MRTAGGVEFGQRIEGRRKARDELAGAVAVFFPKPLCRCVHALLGCPVAFGVIEGGSDAFDPASEIGRAKRADLEGAREAANIERLEA